MLNVSKRISKIFVKIFFNCFANSRFFKLSIFGEVVGRGSSNAETAYHNQGEETADGFGACGVQEVRGILGSHRFEDSPGASMALSQVPMDSIWPLGVRNSLRDEIDRDPTIEIE